MTAKTETETLLELATAAEATARTEAETWNATHRDLAARDRAIAGELATVAGELRAGRLAELTGEKVAGLATLAQHERDLQAEAAEVTARLAIAESEQARTNAIFHSAAEALAMAQIAVAREANVAEAAALNLEINEILGVLSDKLNRRHELERDSPFRWDDPHIPNARKPRAIQIP